MNSSFSVYNPIDPESLRFFADHLSCSDPRLANLVCWMNFLADVVEVTSDGKNVSFEVTGVAAARSLTRFGLPYRYVTLNTLFTAETDPSHDHYMVSFSYKELSAFFLRLFACVSSHD